MSLLLPLLLGDQPQSRNGLCLAKDDLAQRLPTNISSPAWAFTTAERAGPVSEQPRVLPAKPWLVLGA